MTAILDRHSFQTCLQTTAVVGLCFLLAGCPSASNPTQPQSQPPSPSAPGANAPPPSASGSSSGSSGSPGSDSSTAPSSSGAPTAGGTPAPETGRSSRTAGSNQPPGAGSDSSSQGASTGDADSTASAQAGTDPGFGDAAAAGTESLPDMRDTPTMDAGVLAALEAAMEAAAGSSQANGSDTGDGRSDGTAGSAIPGNQPGMGEGMGDGPLTPAEQVAVLDARLESSSGDFDSMILEEQARQRSVGRNSTRPTAPEPEAAGGAAPGDREGPYSEQVAAAGGMGGGGMGNVGTPGGPPVNPAKYPPPEDIPSGNDDDVVARQMREAAMREPDPAVREKLWDEYRKYKGIAP